MDELNNDVQAEGAAPADAPATDDATTAAPEAPAADAATEAPAAE